jgi:hypothetical protein
MNVKKTTLSVLSAAALAVIGCGSSKPSTTQTVTAATGATLTAGLATLTISAGALSANTQVTIREAEPKHDGRVERVEIEPHGLLLLQPAQLSIVVDDKNFRVKMHGADDSLAHVEVEDRNHHSFKTILSTLDSVEVEVEHLTACTTACTTGQECDDGVCKAHSEDAQLKTCAAVCTSGQECDDGACKPHNEAEHTPGAATCNPVCATGQECDVSDGICKDHGGGGGSGH